MAIITTGNNFGATAAVTSTTLNNIANAATFDDPVDGTSLELKVDGKLGIKDAGVTVAKLATDALELAYPVGSVYMNATVATDPATLLGFGTWATFGAGKVPVGIDSTDDDFNVVGSATNTNGTTGSKDAVVVSHSHDVTNAYWGSSGSDDPENNNTFATRLPGAHNQRTNTISSAGESGVSKNLQPYIVVHMWTRTA
jgi:hypothetical protein